MAFDIDRFKEVGGPANFADGGQLYSLSSDTDTLATMLADSYLDGLSGTLNSLDSILLSGTDGAVVVQITNILGVVTVQASANTGAAQALSGPGAIDITSRSTDVTSTGTDALTIADGAIGQLKNITLVVDGGTATLTPANALGYSTIAFADAGDSVQLEFKSGGWALIGQGGLGTGPLSA